MLRQTFIELLLNYTTDHKAIDVLWDELEHLYGSRDRHYHNLSHLEYMLHELIAVKGNITAWHTVLFSLFYHDAVYNVLRSDNEEKSAALAETRLGGIVPADILKNCTQQILATKKHEPSDSDTDYFTDADLSILGGTPDAYTAYIKAIRKEYSIYPDLLYRPGRKKVLMHFLDMPRIFKTGHFFDQYERAARNNLQNELETLG